MDVEEPAPGPDPPADRAVTGRPAVAAERALVRELDLARQALNTAYQQARISGYQPGSYEMTALHRAEQRYQDTRRRRAAQFGLVDLSDQDQPHPAGRADQDPNQQVIDVRERSDDDTGSTSRP